MFVTFFCFLIFTHVAVCEYTNLFLGLGGGAQLCSWLGDDQMNSFPDEAFEQNRDILTYCTLHGQKYVDSWMSHRYVRVGTCDIKTMSINLLRTASSCLRRFLNPLKYFLFIFGAFMSLLETDWNKVERDATKVPSQIWTGGIAVHWWCLSS